MSLIYEVSVKGQRLHHQLLHQCSSACLTVQQLVHQVMQPSMPHSAAVHASELPRQALDQVRQVNQLPADVGTSETQIEAPSRSPEILPCVSELKKLKKCAFSSKRQCSLPHMCTKTVCSFVC